MAKLALRPEVAAFAQLMEAKLRENDHKGGWRSRSNQYLSMRLTQEREELRRAVDRAYDDTTENVREAVAAVGSEAADVANFAMMIADVCGALAPAQQQQAPGPAVEHPCIFCRDQGCVHCGCTCAACSEEAE